MPGAAYTGNGSIDIIETPSAPVGHQDVEIAVAFCGLCGTDLHIVQGHMNGRVTPPHVFGHEMSGVVRRVGSRVTAWSKGDRVTVMPLLWDETCAACLDGNQHICQNLTFIGVDTAGALQSRWVVPERTLVRVPDELSLRDAALVEPTAVAVHDVRRSGLEAGDQAVVLGGGPIGVLIATVARHAGARVLVSEMDASRRARVAALGFDVVDPATDDVAAVVERRTGGAGADVVFEVSGAAAAVRQSTALAKVRGTIVIVAIHPNPRELDLQRVFWRELRLLGARVYRRSDFERALVLLRDGVVATDELISDVVGLDDTSRAVVSLAAGGSMKVLVQVDDSAEGVS